MVCQEWLKLPTVSAEYSSMRQASGRHPRYLSSVLVSITVALSGVGGFGGSVFARPPSALRETSAVYVVVRGDSLAGIASTLGVRLSDLLAANGLSVSSVIHAGDRLAVPGPAAGSVANTTLGTDVAPGVSYSVVAGDTLVVISSKLGVRLTDLLRVNGLRSSSLILPGDTLAVPVGGSLSADVPTTATTPPLPSDSAGRYVVQAGDYLIEIAARNGVTHKALLAANDLIASSSIMPGQSLRLPTATLPRPIASAPIVPSVTSVVPAHATTAAAQPPSAPAAATVSTDQDPMSILVSYLVAQIGKPYVFNTAGPDTFDCSGLVMAAFQQIGVSLPHQSLLQSKLGNAVDWRTSDIEAGDLVFAFSTGKTYISHVGVAISSTQWIQASGSAIPVKLSSLPSDDRIQTVRRIGSGS